MMSQIDEEQYNYCHRHSCNWYTNIYYSLLKLLCVPQTHDIPVSSIMCMVALDFLLKSFTTLHNTTMKQDEKLH